MAKRDLSPPTVMAKVDWSMCIICQEYKSKENLICPANATKDAGMGYTTFLNNVDEFNTLAEESSQLDISIFGEGEGSSEFERKSREMAQKL